MARVSKVSIDDIRGLEPYKPHFVKMFGFVPNAFMTIAHVPELAIALSGLIKEVQSADREVSVQLRTMITEIASATVGCMYCTAHGMHLSINAGIPEEKVAQIMNFESSPLFSPAERAALSYAVAGASSPNAVTDEHIRELKKYYTERQIIEITAQVALMGFFNRFNDSLAVDVEDGPKDLFEKFGGFTGQFKQAS